MFLVAVTGYKKWHVLSYPYQLQTQKRTPFWRNLKLEILKWLELFIYLDYGAKYKR
jgi:hypothetical protein